jgi:NADH:ubiquinone oxidoreductase subunit 4 (subunit M)
MHSLYSFVLVDDRALLPLRSVVLKWKIFLRSMKLFLLFFSSMSFFQTILLQNLSVSLSSVLGMSQTECGFSWMWSGLCLFLMSVALWYSVEYGTETVAVLWFGLLSLAFFLTSDVVMLVVLFEVMNLPLLCMLWYRWTNGVKGILSASVLLVLYGLLSGMLVIVGVGLESGVCLGLGAGVKLALVPVHVWLGKVHVECSTVGSVLLAGVALKSGFYVGMIYLSSLIGGMTASLYLWLFGVMVVQLGLLDAVDGKRMIALFSVAHMQVLMVIAACGMGREGLMFVVTLGMVAHSLVSAGLFFLVGRWVEVFGSRSVHEVVVSSSSLPYYVVLLVGSNCALPVSTLFLVEVWSYVVLLSSSTLWLVLVLLGCTMLSFLACMMVMSRVFGSPTSSGLSSGVGSVVYAVSVVCSLLSWLLWWIVALLFP